METEIEKIESTEDATNVVDTASGMAETKFTAKFFLYWLHCLGLFLLRLITLGIASPYCQCREQKYLAKHAIICGYNLKFNGNSVELIFKNMLWNLLSGITLGIYLFVKRVKIEKWVIKHTAFSSREEREGSSRFSAGGLSYIGLGIKCFLISVFSLGIAFPVALCWRSKYFVNHANISGKRLFTRMTVGDAYKFVLKSLLLTIVTFGLYAFYLPFGIKKFHFSFIDMVDEGEDLPADVEDDKEETMTFDTIARLSSDDLDVNAYIEEVGDEAKAIANINKARALYDTALTKYQRKHEKKKFGGVLLQILSVIVCVAVFVLIVACVIALGYWLVS